MGKISTTRPALLSRPWLAWTLLGLSLFLFHAAPTGSGRKAFSPEYRRDFAEAAGHVPDGVSLATTAHAAPSLSARERIALLPEAAGADYVLAERREAPSGAEAGEDAHPRFSPGKEYGLAFENAHFLLFSKLIP